PTIRRAIALALETSLPLHFLYVVNLDFLSSTSSSRVHTIEEEMREMGEFILLTAQAAAADQGVQAFGNVRHGMVGEQIIALCQEVNARYVVLGAPQRREERNIFDIQRLERFAQRITEQTGARVVIAGETGPL
ncbi:MAG: universal stress protein, partial [Anaerolineae bacterium]